MSWPPLRFMRIEGLLLPSGISARSGMPRRAFEDRLQDLARLLRRRDLFPIEFGHIEEDETPLSGSFGYHPLGLELVHDLNGVFLEILPEGLIETAEDAVDAPVVLFAQGFNGLEGEFCVAQPVVVLAAGALVRHLIAPRVMFRNRHNFDKLLD